MSLPPLFAFGITNLATLGWLAAAAAPLLIHLWRRRRYRETPWAAMEYLLAAVKRQKRRLLVEQWLLLAVRTLLIVLVVLAVAEPFVGRSGLALPAGGGAHRVLVLDGSYSMAYRSADGTRFDRAKRLARRIVERSPRGDAFTLVLMSLPPRGVIETPTLERDAMVREIENLSPSQTAADLPAAIDLVGRILDGAREKNSQLVRHEVYFLTDMQRETWAPRLSRAAAEAFLRRTKVLALSATLLLVDLGQPDAENLAVTGLRVEDPPVGVGREAIPRVDLKNFGRRAIERQPVELRIDGRRVERREVDVAPNGTVSVEFSHRFDAPGDHAIEIHAPGDALEVDNHRFLVASARRSIRALCVEGAPAGRSFGGAADYLAVALTPEDKPTEGVSTEVEVATERALVDQNLDGYDCVFLCNVAQFTSGEARRLDAYLQGGGCLVFFLGDRVSADRYNRVLGGGGQGVAGGVKILPATIGAVVDRPQFRLDPLDFRHPILDPFRGPGEASLLTTPIFKHFKLAVPAGTSAKTVLALADGDPLVVEAPAHGGRVFLVATSAEPSWSGLPLWPSFVPLVQEIVARGIRGRLDRRNRMVGEPLDVAAAGLGINASASVRVPGGRSEPVERRADGDDSEPSFADTSRSGFYVVRFAPPVDRKETFAVNVDTVESDLERVTLDQLRGEVWPGVPFVHQTSWRDLGPADPGAAAPADNRLSIPLLYVVLGLLFVETSLSCFCCGKTPLVTLSEAKGLETRRFFASLRMTRGP